VGWIFIAIQKKNSGFIPHHVHVGDRGVQDNSARAVSFYGKKHWFLSSFCDFALTSLCRLVTRKRAAFIDELAPCGFRAARSPSLIETCWRPFQRCNSRDFGHLRDWCRGSELLPFSIFKTNYFGWIPLFPGPTLTGPVGACLAGGNFIYRPHDSAIITSVSPRKDFAQRAGIWQGARRGLPGSAPPGGGKKAGAAIRGLLKLCAGETGLFGPRSFSVSGGPPRRKRLAATSRWSFRGQHPAPCSIRPLESRGTPLGQRVATAFRGQATLDPLTLGRVRDLGLVHFLEIPILV